MLTGERQEGGEAAQFEDDPNAWQTVDHGVKTENLKRGGARKTDKTQAVGGKLISELLYNLKCFIPG